MHNFKINLRYVPKINLIPLSSFELCCEQIHHTHTHTHARTHVRTHARTHARTPRHFLENAYFDSGSSEISKIIKISRSTNFTVIKLSLWESNRFKTIKQGTNEPQKQRENQFGTSQPPNLPQKPPQKTSHFIHSPSHENKNSQSRKYFLGKILRLVLHEKVSQGKNYEENHFSGKAPFSR